MNYKDSLTKYKRLERKYADSVHHIWEASKHSIHGSDSVKLQALVKIRIAYYQKEYYFEDKIMQPNK